MGVSVRFASYRASAVRSEIAAGLDTCTGSPALDDDEGNGVAVATTSALAAAIGFVWLGMVLAISFLETPLKFRAPDVTLRIGLGIGRIVFRALNLVEAVLAVVILVALALTPPAAGAVLAMIIAVATLVLQLAVVRVRLNRRSRAVLAGAEGPRSRSHYGYVFLEVVKVIALLTGGILLLAG